MTTAVDSGRQRQLLQYTQTLIAELKALPLDAETNRLAFGKVFELVYAFKRFQDATTCMPPSDAKTMWEQRSTWLQEEIAALAAERIQSSDHRQFWSNLFGVLVAAVQACDTAAQQREHIEHQLAMCSRELQEQRAHNEHLNQQLAAAPVAAANAAWTEEALEMKSKLVVAQQELQKRNAEVKQLGMNLQFVEAERDNLQKQTDDLLRGSKEHTETTDRQIEVIQQMMVRNEASSAQLQALLTENAELAQHCQTLSVNLETNARVIEKLIELNTDLMDTLNDRAFTQDRVATQQQQQQQQQQQDNSFSTHSLPPQYPSYTHSSENSYTTVPLASSPAPSTPGRFPVPPIASANGRPPPTPSYAASPRPPLPVSTSAHGHHGPSPSPQGGFQGGDVRLALPTGPSPPPGSPSGKPPLQTVGSASPAPPLARPSLPIQAVKAQSTARPALTDTAAENGSGSSLTAAFQAFLTDPESPKPATAASLAMPAPDNSKPSGPKSGRVLSTAQNLMRYVAGSDLASPRHNPGQQQQQQPAALPV